MNIKLYRYLGERNKIDKSGDLVFVLQTSGEFKGEVSILAPTLVLALPIDEAENITDENGNRIADMVLSSGEGARVLNFNYFYVEEFRRYYYLTGLAVSSNRIAFVSGEVDPLYSFASSIKANSAMIERNEFLYDPLQEDSALPLELEKDITETTPASGSLVNCHFQATFDDDPSYRNIVCTFVNLAGSGDLIDGPGNLPDIDGSKFADTVGNLSVVLDQINAMRLVQSLLGDYSAYNTFFKGLVVYPINLKDFSKYPEPANVTIYKEDLETHEFSPIVLSAQGSHIANNSPYMIVADFSLPSPSNFLDLNPYTHYEVYLPFYGYHELDINQVAGHRILIYYSATFETGAGEVYIYDYTAERLVFSSSVQIGISIALPSTNAQELQTQKNAAQLNLILGLVGSGVGMLGSAATGNAFGLANSGLSAVSSLTGYVNQTSMMFQKAQTTHNGPAGALYAPLEVRLRITRTPPRNGLDLADFAHQFGRPLRQVRRLSDLQGFTQIAKVHLEGIDALDKEKEEIESSLISGVIL